MKFGPFTDATSRVLTYRLTPPANASGRYEFTGDSSVNGALYPITGDTSIELVQRYHPADQDRNFAIGLAEVTAYAAAWKAGETWPAGPNPIPLSYVTSAGSIWKRGETYQFDPSRGAAPSCWISTSNSPTPRLAAQMVPRAERSLPPVFQRGAAAEIHIAANPPPALSPTRLRKNRRAIGRFQASATAACLIPKRGVIRWGVFYDATPRMVSYRLTPPSGVTSLPPPDNSPLMGGYWTLRPPPSRSPAQSQSRSSASRSVRTM